MMMAFLSHIHVGDGVSHEFSCPNGYFWHDIACWRKGWWGWSDKTE